MGEDITANTTHTPEASQEFVITFELVTDESEDDPALVNAVGRDAIIALQQEGYTVRPLYTGQKGGFLVEVVMTVVQIATTVWDNRTVAEEIIADLSGLVTIFGTVLPALKQILHAHAQFVGKEESTTHPIKIVLEIDGAPLLTEAPDVMQADAALKLALQYRSTHPTVAPQVTRKSKVKVQGRITARKRRYRR